MRSVRLPAPVSWLSNGRPAEIARWWYQARMRKLELVALRLKSTSHQKLREILPETYDGLGVTPDAGARDGAFTLRDHGEKGTVIILSNGEMAQRTARALAAKVGEAIQVYEVRGTNSGTRFRFGASAVEATPDGHLREISGVELDFEDLDQQWGGGTLLDRGQRVLREYGALPSLIAREETIGYKRRAAGKPSSPRVATLLAMLKKARTWEGVTLDGGRVELRVGLAAGGRQTSFCTAAEFAELEKLTGRVAGK